MVAHTDPYRMRCHGFLATHHPTKKASSAMSTVKTYADGFGLWHAIVPPGNGTRTMTATLARSAILAELTTRGACAASYARTLRVAFIALTPEGSHYAEV
jgi:hypothetical protein